MHVLSLLAGFCFAEVFGAFYQDPLKLPPKQDEYEFTLDINPGLTMGQLDKTTGDGLAFLWDSKSGTLKTRNNDVCNETSVTKNASLTVTADGLHKRFMAVNDSLPGPPLVVWAGSKVKILVRNNMMAESVTVHWHGQLQKGTFWYDGAGNINQCPIRAGESFTYEFVANPPGTYFYHGHFVTDRGDGLIGAFVVLDHQNNQTHVQTSSGPEKIDKQFAILLHDWYKTSTANEYMYAKWGLNQFRYGWTNMEKCYGETKTYDGSKVGELTFHAALINGRGWQNATDLIKNPENFPINRYKITKNETVVLRIVNSGIMYPFMFSVQGHKLRIISGDGNLIEETTVDFVILSLGERFDVILKPIGGTRAKKGYYMISQSIEMYQENMKLLGEDHFTLALLECLDCSDKAVVPSVSFPPKDRCSNQNPCVVANCPFAGFAALNDTYTCFNPGEMKHGENQTSETLKPKYEGNFQEYFLNMFVDKNMAGLSFAYPLAPPALFQDTDAVVTKSCEGLSRDGTQTCTQTLELKKNAVVQIVLFNRGAKFDSGETLDAFPHPIHIHGHHFYVVKTGYPHYSDINGLILDFNDDIKCVGGSGKHCNVAEWTNSSWANGSVPGLNLINPPLKDTVQVPVGGYVVLRFVADNPGFWISHCHMLPHHLDGMALLIKEGDLSDMPPRPDNYPQCFAYHDQVGPSPSGGGGRVVPGIAAVVALVCLMFWQ